MSLINVSFNTPIGVLNILHDEQHVHQAIFANLKTLDLCGSGVFLTGPIKQIAGNSSQFTQQLCTELSAYFENAHHRFQLPLKPHGTPYQRRVWNSLLVIPSGRTVTYGELSAKLQTSPRAIGQACKKNPLALFIPCHRVVGKNHIGGYMGKHIAYKLSLLNHEGVSRDTPHFKQETPKAFLNAVDNQ